MGDRANVIVKCGDQQVCLYTHWTGSELPETVRLGLIRGESRWNDFQYLTRIIFCEMVDGADHYGTTGYGITQQIHDGGETVVINCDDQTVTVRGGKPVLIAKYVQSEQDEKPEE